MTSTPRIPAAWLRRALLSWYHTRKRALPWRDRPTPYRVWISEIMLQQTQIQTVLPYYKGWMKRFPSLRQLAEAHLDEVLKHWAGLGYYSRARNLHKAARILDKDHRGRFPRENTTLEQLPGIGRYTAAAIASIAFGEPVAVLDGNVMRVLSRLTALKSDIQLSRTQSQLWEEAQRLLDPETPGDFNQAMMELGALVCTPRSPRCPECPLRHHCRARREGQMEQYPVKGRKTLYEKLDVALGILWQNGRVLIQRRPPGPFMGGLWEFPGGKIQAGETPEQALHREMKEELNIQVAILGQRAPIRHAYTRFRVTLFPFDCRTVSGKLQSRAAEALSWEKPEDLVNFPFPSANSKLIPELIRKKIEVRKGPACGGQKGEKIFTTEHTEGDRR